MVQFVCTVLRIAPCILGVCFILLAHPTIAQDENVKHPTPPNGCGSGWSLPFVPNSLPLIGCQFRKACDNHDVCYGRCELSTAGECEYRRCVKGGDLYNDDICFTDLRLINLGIKAFRRKSLCDDGLCNDIRALNKGKPICEAFAEVYRVAVEVLGRDAFQGIQGIDTLLELGQSKEEYGKALQQFFEHGTDAQFSEFVRKVDSGAQPVDLKRAIVFDQGGGLINVPRK